MDKKNESKTYVEVLHEVHREICDVAHEEDKGFELYFEECVYHYSSGITEHGYRFIRRKPNGRMQSARGQACIPTIKMIHELLQDAENEGWGHDGRYGHKSTSENIS